LFVTAGFAKNETTVQVTYTYSGGDGTEQSPYLISSKVDMEDLAEAVSEGESYAGAYFLLTCNLTTANDTITTVIGSSYDLCFSGIFDGGNHEIAVNNTGVFGVIKDATISNLGISGKIKSYSYRNYYDYYDSYDCYVGGVCGAAYSSTIVDCYNGASISVSVPDSYYDNSYVGGICGYGNGIVTNCFIANKSINNTGGMTGTGRIAGDNGIDIAKCYALSSILINNAIVTNGLVNNWNGLNQDITSFQDQAWIEENLEWDFENVWRMPEGNYFPILKNVVFVPNGITSRFQDNISIFPNPATQYFVVSGIK